MASVVESTPPSLPYKLTTTGSNPNTKDSRELSPRQVPLPISPSPSSPPPVYRICSTAALNISPNQFRHPVSPVAKLPSTVTRTQPKSPTPPPRPPRPQKSLPNLRPTVILSPALITALPESDRPAATNTRSPSPQHLYIPSPSSSYSSTDQFSTPLPSPAFFAPRTWHKPIPTYAHTSPYRSPTSSKSASPKRSPSSPHTYYYNSKWQYENIVSRDSITALPPPPLPPPDGPLPALPIPTSARVIFPDSHQIQDQQHSQNLPTKPGLGHGTSKLLSSQNQNPKRHHRRPNTRHREKHKPARSPSAQPTNLSTTFWSVTPPVPVPCRTSTRLSSKLFRQLEPVSSLSEKIPVVPNSYRVVYQHQHQHDHHHDHHHPGSTYTSTGFHAHVCASRPKQSGRGVPPLAELEGSPLSVPEMVDSIDDSDSGEDGLSSLTWFKRHRRKFMMIGTALVVLSIAAGILGGIIWRLERIRV